jgi:hypothetical protein
MAYYAMFYKTLDYNQNNNIFLRAARKKTDFTHSGRLIRSTLLSPHLLHLIIKCNFFIDVAIHYTVNIGIIVAATFTLWGSFQSKSLMSIRFLFINMAMCKPAFNPAFNRPVYRHQQGSQPDINKHSYCRCIMYQAFNVDDIRPDQHRNKFESEH